MCPYGFPVVRDNICAPGHQGFGGKIVFDRARSSKNGNPEKRRKRLWITERGVNRSNTGIDLTFEFQRVQPLKCEGVILAVSADGVTLYMRRTTGG